MIPGKGGAVSQNACRKTYEKQLLESNIPWHSDNDCRSTRPRAIASPQTRSPSTQGEGQGTDCWGNLALALRSATSLTSTASGSQSSQRSRVGSARAAMTTSRGLWRDLPRYSKSGTLENTGPAEQHPAPFDVDFAGHRVQARTRVASDDALKRPSCVSPARLRYLLEMHGSSPTTRELVPARRRPRSKVNRPRSLSPPSAAPKKEPIALAQERLGSWMSLGEAPCNGLAEVLAKPGVPPRATCASEGLSTPATVPAAAAAPAAPQPQAACMRPVLVLPVPSRLLREPLCAAPALQLQR